MANVNSILTQTRTEFNQAVSNNTTGTELGKEQFLQLLVTQLQHQDPLNPMEDQEFIAQMAQFSSLEQLMNLNTSMQGLTDATNNQQMFSATNYIGKYVTAVGNVIGKSSSVDADGNTTSEVTPLYYSFNAPTASGSITVRDSSGNVVYVQSLDAQSSGTIFKFSWDGKNGSGASVADGTYTVSVTGIDSNGEAVLCTPMVADKVTDILRDGSTIYLRLEGGQNMTLADVELVSSTRPTLATDGSEDAETPETKPETPETKPDDTTTGTGNTGTGDASGNGNKDDGNGDANGSGGSGTPDNTTTPDANNAQAA